MGGMSLPLLLPLAAPSDWVPARWHWLEAKTLELLSGSPVNCLLVDWNAQQKAQAQAFAAAAGERGMAPLAVIRPGDNVVEAARGAISVKLTGIVLEGDFPAGAAE